MSKPKTEMPESLRLFSTWLEDHAQGHANDEITADLAAAVESVQAHNKAAKVTIVVDLEPAGGHGRQITTRVTSTAKPAKGDPEASIFYVGPAGSLHRDDPYEPKLVGIQVPETDHGPSVNIDPATGVVITPGDATDEQ
jgi:hypothetical protein